MMKKMLQRGFTLIELLVVIAIIGILAAVVLASLNDARDSGSDASVKQSLANLRSQAEIEFNRNGAFTYANVCTAGATLLNAAAQATQSTVATINVAGAWNIGSCSNAPGEWAASVPLSASANGAPVHWCVDSSGAARQVSAALGANDTDCPAATP